MATIHTDDSEESVKVQNETSCDKMSKTHLMLGVLGVVTTIAVAYAVIKKINNK